MIAWAAVMLSNLIFHIVIASIRDITIEMTRTNFFMVYRMSYHYHYLSLAILLLSLVFFMYRFFSFHMMFTILVLLLLIIVLSFRLLAVLLL